jgi:hypothetical protein
MDLFIKEIATKEAWEELQEKQLIRAYKFAVDILKTPLTREEFKNVWYSQTSDKKGEKFLANMCMSMFQSRKASAGNSSEKAIKKMHDNADINVKYQVYCDNTGLIYDKKPNKISVHKLDAIISQGDTLNISKCIVLSMKTTLRERYRQDLDIVGKCKKLIFLTRETPEKTKIETISGYGCILVYPYSELTDTTWSYNEYILRMKLFQETGCYNRS